MSKFKKVSEAEELPKFISNKFVGASNNEDDRFAHLRDGSDNRRLKIARESQLADKEQNVRQSAYDFETALAESQPQIYESDRRASNEGVLLNHRSIRRASYDVDEGDNARDLLGGLKAFDESEYMTAMIRGASIFDPNPELDDVLLAAAEEDNKLFDKRETRDIISDRKSAWEKNARDSIRAPKTVMSRANGILRTSTEEVATGAFGIHNPDALFEAEERRTAMAEAKREQRLAIKREGKTLEEKAREWEETGVRSTSLRDAYSGNGLKLNIDEYSIDIN